MIASGINPIITLKYLNSKEENQYFERKGIEERGLKPSKIADELIGMLNADGGVLALGVSDKGEIQDVESLENNLDKYKSLVFDFIKPSCNIPIEELIIDEKKVLLYHVESDHERLFCRKDSEKVFRRVLDTNRKLNLEQIKKLEYDKTIRKFEEELVHDFDWKDLDKAHLNKYKQKLKYTGDTKDLLCKRYLTVKQKGSYLIKNSAILLFAQDPEKYIPSASLRYLRYEGTEALSGTEHNVIKDQRFEGNIPNLIQEVRAFLKASLKDYYFLDMNEGRFKRVPEYPEDAWLEGIVNALCHRSYNNQGNSIYIKQFDDRIIISNSGPLPAQVTVENIKSERYARNPRVARVLEDLGYVRQLNEGVTRIYESMEKSMLSVPEYKEVNGTVYLTLRNKISNHSKTIHDSILNQIEEDWSKYSETQKLIFYYLFNNQSATKEELAKYCNAHVNTIGRHLNKLIKRKLLERNSTKIRDAEAKYTFKKH